VTFQRVLEQNGMSIEDYHRDVSSQSSNTGYTPSAGDDGLQLI